MDEVTEPQPPAADSASEIEEITQSLYKQNMELAVRNKTLSILSKLYDISIQSLSSQELAEKISKIIQADFGFERVGIFSYDDSTDTLNALAYSESQRFADAHGKADRFFDQTQVEYVKDNVLLGPIISSKKMGYTESLESLWGTHLEASVIERIRKDAHVRALLSWPLISQDKIIGFFVLTLNRTYDELGEFERESISSFSDLISIALAKSRLYEELALSNRKLEEANDRLKQLDQLKSEFLSVASHQLRAPITAIHGYIANILESSYGEVPAYLNEPLEVIEESVRIMINSIEDYLNVSRIEQGRMKYDIAPVNISALAKRACEELKPLAEKKGLTLTYVDSPEITIDADLGKVKQVFTNLIDNCIKYTPTGSVTVTLEKDETKQVARFKTSDTGIGIQADELNLLFEKFTRARDANKVNTTGTGLGLYVAKNLVEGHHGMIKVTSEGLGKGSQFIVELPFIQPVTQPIAETVQA